MSTIIWAEDHSEFVRDMIATLEEDYEHTVELFADVVSFEREMRRIVGSSSVIVLDLWLPLGGESTAPRDATARGLWLVERLQETMEDLRCDRHLLILSSNLDVDTQVALSEEYHIASDRIFKKPVAYELFLELLNELCS